MNASDLQSLIAKVDELIFFHTGEHLDDLQQDILEGTFDHKKYAEIAKNNHHSEKYVKDLAGKLWQTISAALGEEVSKSNIKSTLQRYYYSNFSNSNVINTIKINKGNICTGLPESELKQSSLDQEIKLEIVTELIKEGLSVEQIARVLKLPLELVQEHIQNSQ
jgi:DNA-binding CsgD family transcriptional regulator